MKIIYENQFYKLVESRSKTKKKHSHYKIIDSVTNSEEYEFKCNYCIGCSDDLQSLEGEPFNDIVEDIISELEKKYKVRKNSSLEYQVIVDETTEVKKLECYYDIFCKMRRILGYNDESVIVTIWFDYTNLIRKELQNNEYQKRRKTDPKVELKKVTMKINKEIYEQFSDYARNELNSNVTAEVEKFMKNIKEPKVVININNSAFLTKEEVMEAMKNIRKKQ